MKPKETIPIEIPKSRMMRPIPLIWGILAFALFVGFAAVTQIQFNRLNQDKIDQVEQAAYDVAVKANSDCVASIEVRETYRSIFNGIEVMFRRTADLPFRLFPESEFAQQYKSALDNDVKRYISVPVSEQLKAKTEASCPQVPEERPK